MIASSKYWLNIVLPDGTGTEMVFYHFKVSAALVMEKVFSIYWVQNIILEKFHFCMLRAKNTFSVNWQEVFAQKQYYLSSLSGNKSWHYRGDGSECAGCATTHPIFASALSKDQILAKEK